MTESNGKVTTFIRGQADILAEAIAALPDGSGKRMLDIGTGSGLAARAFLAAGWDVTATGFDVDAYLTDQAVFPEGIELHENVDVTDMTLFPDASFDVVWCAHVLEHVLDTGRALAEIRRVLKPDGLLLVTVPPAKSTVVGGHVSNGWNVGNLMYVLAVTGFDLRSGRFVRHGYNIFGEVGRGEAPPRSELRFANGDLERLTELGSFPEGFKARQGFEGNLQSVNWKWHVPPQEIAVPRAALAQPPAIPSMRLGFFVPWITKSRGGTENVGHMMANAMAARGHDVVIFTFDDARGRPVWPLDPAIRLVHLPEGANARVDDQMAMIVAAEGRELLVGLHMNRTFSRYVRCAHRLGLPIVLSEHIDPRMPDWIGTFSAEEREIAFFGATLIHLLTEGFRQTLGKSHQDRIRVVPNTVRDTDKRADPGAEGVKYLLCVARLVPRKNVRVLIEAFAQVAGDHPDWMLRIVGDGSERAALAERAEGLGLGDRIEFLGEVDDPYPLYASAHAFVLPSTLEGFPMVTCEAMAHGLPLVGYAVCSGVNEQIVPGENGFLASGGRQVGSLGEELHRIMADAGLRAQMGRASRLRYERLYSQEVIAKAWEEMFAEALERGPVRVRAGQRELLNVRLAELVGDPLRIAAENIH
ncbi:glycosyltransferase [Qingshengfaniella alkalisoli]|uniref:Glycosyltransferase n=1 Tax=Qingshengfaniella alkalisoli TaxID=2599296 RepID=A0A5B8J829_9RHOB|nr:glycosyltransferase [Qingshengfaniella alkalisoli]QDY70410.1 glycosyltransferase [Qingshengfaniella alkalisoli]